MPRAKKGVLTYRQFSDMSYEQLLRKLKEMLAQAQRITVWFNAAERLQLLPALQAMHDKVAQPGRRIADPNKPNWADVCLILGITPDLVKKWKTRTAAETDIRHLLGEDFTKPGPPKPDDAAALKKQLALLVSAVLSGDEEHAEQLAAALAERYEF
jgi:hypothetical protein